MHTLIPLEIVEHFIHSNSCGLYLEERQLFPLITSDIMNLIVIIIKYK